MSDVRCKKLTAIRSKRQQIKNRSRRPAIPKPWRNRGFCDFDFSPFPEGRGRQGRGGAPPYGKEGTGVVEPRSAAAKNFWFFFKKEQPYLLSYFQKPFPNRENLDSAMLVTNRFFLIVSQNQPSSTRQSVRQFL